MTQEAEMAYSFTKRELDVIMAALHERRESLRDYVEWITDHPMLPEQGVAINNIQKEDTEINSLFLKLYTYKHTT